MVAPITYKQALV